MNSKLQLNKGDIIKDGDTYYSVFCVVWNVIYVKVVPVMKENYIELMDVLEHYRKIEIMNEK